MTITITPHGHDRKIHGRNLIVHSVNTDTFKTVDRLTANDWCLFTEPMPFRDTDNRWAVRDLNNALVEGLATWSGRSATLEDAKKIAAPVIVAMKRWADHGANDTEGWTELYGILIGIGFNINTLAPRGTYIRTMLRG